MRRVPGFARIVSPSNGSPDACARRCRTVDPGGPAELVEVDEAVVDSGQDGDRRRELRHRCPPEASLRVAVLGKDAVRPDERRGGMVGSPAVDRCEGAVDVGCHVARMLAVRLDAVIESSQN